jgi:hypothetical protein
VVEKSFSVDGEINGVKIPTGAKTISRLQETQRESQ